MTGMAHALGGAWAIYDTDGAVLLLAGEASVRWVTLGWVGASRHAMTAPECQAWLSRQYPERMDVEVTEYPKGGAPRRGAAIIKHDASGTPLTVWLRLVQERAGAKRVKPWEVRDISVSRTDDGPVTSVLLRKVPVAELAAQAVAAFSAERPKITVARLDELRDAGARGLSDETLRLVALVYEDVLSQNGNPVQEVVEAFGISRSTATRWIRRARDREYIVALERENEALD